MNNDRYKTLVYIAFIIFNDEYFHCFITLALLEKVK